MFHVLFHAPLIKHKCSVFQENTGRHNLKEMLAYDPVTHGVLDCSDKWWVVFLLLKELT